MQARFKKWIESSGETLLRAAQSALSWRSGGQTFRIYRSQEAEQDRRMAKLRAIIPPRCRITSDGVAIFATQGKFAQVRRAREWNIAEPCEIGRRPDSDLERG